MVKVGDLLYYIGDVYRSEPWKGGIHLVLAVKVDARNKRNSAQYDEVTTMASSGETGRFWLKHEFPADGTDTYWRRVDL